MCELATFCIFEKYDKHLTHMKRFLYIFFLILPFGLIAQDLPTFIKENYTKHIHRIPMTDGTKLYTHVYIPKDASPNKKYPMVMMRTCYSIAPYDETSFPARLGPSETMVREKYIFVHQDVRGRWMSEGTWTNMTPNNPGNGKNIPPDESSDTYDTVDWLVKNIPHNNGRVGQWGGSYPGFYTTAGTIDAHPALKASSPQAPIADFFFDDFHHNGAFTQAYLFTFPVFGKQHNGPTPTAWYTEQNIDKKTRDGYQFHYELGSLKHVAEKYYKDNFYWKETVEHPNYDEFWQKRNILPHLKNIKPATMVVGGWFDAEDLYGPLNTYKAIRKQNPNKKNNSIVMGPFDHGGWGRERGQTMHTSVYFGDSIATFYQRNIEAKFFRHYLKESGDGKTGLPEAYMFDTGAKKWGEFDQWPPKEATKLKFYLSEDGKLKKNAPSKEAHSEFISDPLKPVPYTEDITTTMGFTARNYMSEDQRFAARRPDVLVFETDVLTEDITLAGEIINKLMVSTSQSDADWIVKLIDVYPPDEPDHAYMPHKNITLSNYHQMVRSEIMRGRFRNSFEKPEPFVSNKKTEVKFALQDVYHTFKKGHKIQIQVQSTWFPLFDRNPQKYVDNIYKAEDSDFVKALHKVFNDSYIEVDILK
jgi:putative CocE/NonD family hydrolase